LNVGRFNVEGVTFNFITFELSTESGWYRGGISFVPDMDEGFLFYWTRDHGQTYKEARMKKIICINFIFWNEGPLLPRLLTFK
jgi:hypothetical protein